MYRKPGIARLIREDRNEIRRRLDLLTQEILAAGIRYDPDQPDDMEVVEHLGNASTELCDIVSLFERIDTLEEAANVE